MEKLKISVQTLTNGYALTVDNNKYMYHSINGLLEGFMYHVGLEELGYIDNDNIKNFLTASVVWKADNGETAKKMLKMKEENDSLKKMCENYQIKIKRLEAKTKSLNIKDDDEDDDDIIL